MHTARLPTPLHLLPALLAWLLLALQAPWHTGMQGGHTLALPGELAALGIACGPRPDAATRDALVDAGLLAPAPAGADASLCDLFATLLAPAAGTLPPELPALRTGAPVDAVRRTAPVSIPFPLPPARGPPLHA